MNDVTIVGMADYKTGLAPRKLMTIGLGSCIGICLYDVSLQIGGMAHVMLPTSTGKKGENPAKYADSGIAVLLDDLLKKGVSKFRLKAKIAGGASMFSFGGESQMFKIGEQNAEKVKQELIRLAIPIVAMDVGGTFGRTISFDLKTGELLVKTINHGQKII